MKYNFKQKNKKENVIFNCLTKTSKQKKQERHLQRSRKYLAQKNPVSFFPSF